MRTRYKQTENKQRTTENKQDKPDYMMNNQYNVHKKRLLNNEKEQEPQKTCDLPATVDEFDEMTFLSEPLLCGIHTYGFKYPSLIQSKTIHIINSGCDLIAQSQSGTGKTGAFAIGALSRVDQTLQKPQIIMIVNTRDLAMQICGVVKNISKFMGINIVTCIGGTTNNYDMAQKITTAQVIIGTPGKINELILKHILLCDYIKTLIFDETDVLLQDNFRDQTLNIIYAMNQTTQICVFSATFTKDILQITEQFLNNPYRVTVVNEELSVQNIKQYKIIVGIERNKYPTLLDLFSTLSFTQLIIFVNSIHVAENLRTHLAEDNISTCVVHGKMSSVDRDGILTEFRLCSIKILIATDLICRGIDIDDLRLVINYDMPNNKDAKETYLHRVGRSGRFGCHGVALNFCTHNDIYKINAIERAYNIQINDMPYPEEVNDILNRMSVPADKVSGNNNIL